MWINSNFGITLSKRGRLNTDRIILKSKNNKNVMKPWQSRFKRDNRNSSRFKLWERNVMHSLSDQIRAEIDKQIIAELVALYGK